MLLDGYLAESIALAANALRDGALVAFPTETVYGLGADADNDAAVAGIFAAKGRPSDHPLIVHVDDTGKGADGVAHFAARVPDYAQALMDAFWPGPLTLILPRRAGVGTAAAGGQDSIGLRCPDHPVAQALLHACRARGVLGLAAPSANRFGRISTTTATHVRQELGEDLLVLDGGPCVVGIESTIIDCTRGAPIQLRPGAIGFDQVLAHSGRVAQRSDRHDQGLAAPRASGTLEAHYAPNAKLRLMDAKALQTALDLLGSDVGGSSDAPVIATYARVLLRSASGGVLRRRMPEDAASTARQLFSVLREFDALGVKLIWVETPPEGVEWDGVRDRLQRASVAG
jgi:L-threonylcarbamoyladenylate synthase